MAVHEETAVSPEWGDRLDPTVLNAIKDKKLLPIAELDRGFIRPSYGGQVIVSYYQAGRICDYINQKWGWDKLLAMMHDFANSDSTPDVVRKELGISPEELISCHIVLAQWKLPGLRPVGLSIATIYPNVTPNAPSPGIPMVRTAKSS
jgi:hypothetical protein